MNALGYLVLAVLCGVALAVQASLNARMAQAAGNPVWGALISFVTGGGVLLAVALLSRTPFSLAGTVREAPGYTWLAGLLGAFYVATAAVILPRLGPALTFGLVIGGQMLLAVLLDHFGWLGVPVREISLGRVLGVVLVIAGVILIRRF
jgi:transporter family-2 protein